MCLFFEGQWLLGLSYKSNYNACQQPKSRERHAYFNSIEQLSMIRDDKDKAFVPIAMM